MTSYVRSDRLRTAESARVLLSADSPRQLISRRRALVSAKMERERTPTSALMPGINVPRTRRPPFGPCDAFEFAIGANTCQTCGRRREIIFITHDYYKRRTRER